MLFGRGRDKEPQDEVVSHEGYLTPTFGQMAIHGLDQIFGGSLEVLTLGPWDDLPRPQLGVTLQDQFVPGCFQSPPLWLQESWRGGALASDHSATVSGAPGG